MEEVERERAAFALERAHAKAAKAGGSNPAVTEPCPQMPKIEANTSVAEAPEGNAAGDAIMSMLFKADGEHGSDFKEDGDMGISSVPFPDMVPEEDSPSKGFTRSRAGR